MRIEGTGNLIRGLKEVNPFTRRLDGKRNSSIKLNLNDRVERTGEPTQSDDDSLKNAAVIALAGVGGIAGALLSLVGLPLGFAVATGAIAGGVLGGIGIGLAEKLSGNSHSSDNSGGMSEGEKAFFLGTSAAGAITMGGLQLASAAVTGASISLSDVLVVAGVGALAGPVFAGALLLVGGLLLGVAENAKF